MATLKQDAYRKDTPVYREDTPVEIAVKDSWGEANVLLQRIARESDMLVHVPELQGACFCGHLVADLDSIAGAYGASRLYGGRATRASEVNAETQWAMAKWEVGIEEIALIDEVVAAEPDSRICLVDFQQKTQLSPAIKEEQIVGIIDHHALQSSTIVTTRPIYVDIRPWGSMSTIVAHSYIVSSKAFPRPVAGMLLSAILSDTLNLRSPTTTEWDGKMVSLLVQFLGVSDVNMLCAEQFKAKSKNLASLSAYVLASGDLKRFKFGAVKVAFAVIETTDSPAMLRRTSEMIPEMRILKKELEVPLMFLAIVDIVDLHTHLVVCGPGERSLAVAAGFDARPLADDVKEWAGPAHLFLLSMAHGKVSRKADFLPPLTKAFEENHWTPPADQAEDPEKTEDLGESVVVFEPTAPGAPPQLLRRKLDHTTKGAGSSKRPRTSSACSDNSNNNDDAKSPSSSSSPRSA